jgi:hypothetical protein
MDGESMILRMVDMGDDRGLYFRLPFGSAVCFDVTCGDYKLWVEER